MTFSGNSGKVKLDDGTVIFNITSWELVAPNPYNFVNQFDRWFAWQRWFYLRETKMPLTSGLK